MANNNQGQENNTENTPFFERYLEEQESEELSEEEANSISGGMTKKKGESSGIENPKLPAGFLIQTRRYPSDDETFGRPISRK